MAQLVEIANPQEFDQEFPKFKSQERLFLWFSGSIDTQTQQNWCSDCVAAEPTIDAAIKKMTQGVILKCPVGQKSEWRGNQSHPYRKYAKCVPTVMRLNKGIEVIKLEEGQLCDQELTDELFTSNDY